MSKWANDSVLDTLLDKVATSTQLIVTASQPADRAAAIAGALSSVAVDSGDFAKSNGTPTGRTLTVGTQNNISVTAAGTAGHICLVDGTSLLWVTTATPQLLEVGNTVTVPQWTINVADPV